MPFRSTPIEHLNDAITTAAAALQERDRVKALIGTTRAELSRRNERVRLLKARLRKEERGFTRFDRMSLPSLIHGVLGTRDKKRREEFEAWRRGREELLDAMADRDRLVEEVRGLQTRWAYLEHAPGRLQTALALKSAWLRDHDQQAGERLSELAQGEREATVLLKKVESALEFSRKVTGSAVDNSGSANARQVALLEVMRKNKILRLRSIWDERRSLLLDGARYLGEFEETIASA